MSSVQPVTFHLIHKSTHHPILAEGAVMFFFNHSNMETIKRSEPERYRGPIRQHRNLPVRRCRGVAHLGKRPILTFLRVGLILLLLNLY